MGESVRMSVHQLQESVQEFNDRRAWTDRHSIDSLSKAICVEAAELLELSLWAEDQEDSSEAICLEMADVAIYLLSLANLLGVGLEDIVLQKLAINAERFPSPP